MVHPHRPTNVRNASLPATVLLVCDTRANDGSNCQLTVFITAASQSNGLDADGLVLSQAFEATLGAGCVEVLLGKLPPDRSLTYRDVAVTLEHPTNHSYLDDSPVWQIMLPDSYQIYVAL